MKKEQKERYIKKNDKVQNEVVIKEQKKLSLKAKISILVVSGILALGAIIGLVFVLSSLLNR